MRPTRTPLKTPQRSRDNSVAKDPILVYCRVRPCDNSTDEVCLSVEDEKRVKLIPPEKLDCRGKTIVTGVECTFERVFPSTISQQELFNHVSKPLVADLFSGFNGLLFTYGITSSGKTFTMSGTPENSGLLPRTLDAIFNSIGNSTGIRKNPFIIKDAMKGLPKTPRSKRTEEEWSVRVPDETVIDNVDPNKQYKVLISYVEIYNKYIYDLLDGTTPRRSKEIGENKMTGQSYVKDVKEVEVRSTNEAIKHFIEGQNRRQVGSTSLNNKSSRSHCVFTICLKQAPIDSLGENEQCSKLSLVDLAGSERNGRTHARNAVFKEAANINLSLMNLRKCIDYLSGRTNERFPYRADKLTWLFQSYFEGQGKVRMVVCVNPHVDNAGELVRVLEFAEKTREVVIPRATPVLCTPSSMSASKTGRSNLYKQVVKRTKAFVPVSDMRSPVVYTLGPEFPNLSISLSDDEEVYDNIIQFLETRIERRSSLRADLTRRQQEFRRLLVTLESENRRLVQENSRISADLNCRQEQFENVEEKLAHYEQEKSTFERQLSNMQNKLENKEREIKVKDRQIDEMNQKIHDITSRRQEDLSNERARCRRIMERQIARKEAEHEDKMCLKEEILRQMREILASVDANEDGNLLHVPQPSYPPTLSETTESSSETSLRTRMKRRSDEAQTQVKYARTCSDLDVVRRSRPQTRVAVTQPSSTNDFDALFLKEDKPASSQRHSQIREYDDSTISGFGRQSYYAPPKLTEKSDVSKIVVVVRSVSTFFKRLKSVAIANLRHRRSRSSGSGIWVEHKPLGNLELNTVYQPTMKKRKSVSKLTKNDIVKNEKYLLEHQEQDSQGEIETQLYKGDIIPSAGGGAQVVFNDIEKLRQASPPGAYNLRKRSGGENINLREIEEKCSVSVECHGIPSKVQKRK